MNQSLIEDVLQGIATITFNRPERLNSYDLEMLVQLQQSLERLSEREDVRVVVVNSSGSAFCTGCDLQYVYQLLQSGDLKGFRRLVEATKQVILLLHRMPQMVIASVDGVACDGGMNLALSCDFRIASNRSRFGYPSTQLGWSPEVGTTMSLLPVLGAARTTEFILSAKWAEANDALGQGLVNRLCPPHDLLDRTLSYARKLADGPPMALRTIKRALFRGIRQYESCLDSELEGRIRCFLSGDLREGIEAFLHNRNANFKGV